RPPAGSLTVTQNRAAVVDDVTGELHVDISCGTFTDLGQPPVNVVWQTPSGDLLKSTSYADGRFHLLLENPVTGGNYTCRLSSDSHTAGCLPSSDPLRGQATLVVNEQIARLTLLEANQAALAKQNREDINHLEAQNAILTQHVHGLQNQNANLTQYVHQLEAQLGRYQQENSNLTGYIHTLESELSRLSVRPPAVDGSLTVTQSRAAVVDNVTGELHVDISCGTFTDLGQPPVSVVWKTPSGAYLPSTSDDGEHFHILLENPVSGGDYTCRLSSGA
ncbi:hypothetical protein BaRGS_00039467, partial [Batillaria attramentaria]